MQVKTIEKAYRSFLSQQDYPCVGAKAAVAAGKISCLVAGNMKHSSADQYILDFLYEFVDSYRQEGGSYHSAAIIFSEPQDMTEAIFEKLIWERLQSLHDLDSLHYDYDKRVAQDPDSSAFSFSVKEEAMFIIGLHPASSRKARRFQYPALAFNPHRQFDVLRENGKYDSFKHAVRKRDEVFSGSVNPMLSDFGSASEARQYSGKPYEADWKCPLTIKHV